MVVYEYSRWYDKEDVFRELEKFSLYQKEHPYQYETRITIDYCENGDVCGENLYPLLEKMKKGDRLIVTSIGRICKNRKVLSKVLEKIWMSGIRLTVVDIPSTHNGNSIENYANLAATAESLK